MKFTLRQILIGITMIAIVLAAWIPVANYLDHQRDYLDHQGDGIGTKQLETALRLVNESDPTADVSGRIKDGDYRYAGCWGEPGGPYFPGVPQTEWQGIRNANNYWTLDGTTDALESRHHDRLIERAWRYAERYNTNLRSRKPTLK